MIELQVGKCVERVDAGDPIAVHDLRQAIEDYLEDTLPDRDRTHRHNIDRAGDEMRASGHAADLARFEALLAPLRYADNDYLDDVKQVVEDALSALARFEDATDSRTPAPGRSLPGASTAGRRTLKVAHEHERIEVS